MNRVTRTAVALAAVVVMSGTLAACQNARIGQRCRGNGFAQTSSQILQCKAGRWRFLMTKAQYVQLIIALRNRSTTTTVPPTTVPPTTAPTTTAPPAPLAYALGPGDEHTCAVIADEVKCIGRNASGELGNGTLADSPTTWVSTGLTETKSVSSGPANTCALRRAGTVYCWGYGDDGQMGDGSSAGSLTPRKVYGITTATKLSTGSLGACAVLADSTARCWGDGWLRGDGDSSEASTPATVIGAGMTDIAVGDTHACATKLDGTVWCWGRNLDGQLGDGTFADSLLPVQVTGITTATGISASGSTSCALLSSGGVSCWGSNGLYNLGIGGTDTSDQPSPTTVVGLTDAVQVAAGWGSTCARRAGGTIVCWGAGGRLGDGTSTSSSVPVPTSNISTAIDLTAGPTVTCAVLADHSGRCWGPANSHGQLANGATSTIQKPGIVIGMP